MANLVNPTPLNVAAPAQARGTLSSPLGAPASVEPRTPQIAVAGHTAGAPGFATPHVAAPPPPAGTGHSPPTTNTASNGTQQKK